MPRYHSRSQCLISISTLSARRYLHDTLTTSVRSGESIILHQKSRQLYSRTGELIFFLRERFIPWSDLNYFTEDTLLPQECIEQSNI